MGWWFGAWLACTLPAESGTAPGQEVVDQAALGAEQARKDLEIGIVQVLSFGELMPDDYTDSKTGLPVGSMGCEIDDERQPYLDAYNGVVIQYIKDKPPFPNDLVIDWSVALEDAEPVGELRVTAAGVTVDGKEVPSLWRDRLMVGVLGQSLFGKSLGPRQREGSTVYQLTMERGSRHWSATWGEEGPIAPPSMVDLLQQWRRYAVPPR